MCNCKKVKFVGVETTAKIEEEPIESHLPMIHKDENGREYMEYEGLITYLPNET